MKDQQISNTRILSIPIQPPKIYFDYGDKRKRKFFMNERAAGGSGGG
jgi:hypothetical protein